MAKGPESWKIPSEDEVKDLYGDDEKLEQKVARANELAGDGTHKITLEQKLEERKGNLLLMGMILVGVIIVAIVVSVAITIINASKEVSSMENSVENQNQMKSNADIDDQNSVQEGTNNMYPEGYGQSQPMTPYEEGQPAQPMAQPTPQPTPLTGPEAYQQALPSAEPQGQAYPTAPQPMDSQAPQYLQGQ